ncbi:MAG: hypothetical protein CM1200mP2_58410 [Planctomycetaceae bacterium]|nr:MAG: hypothetical protein CM1200mP2_58410 [Planctomycetaceae bacterium]
MTRQRLLSLALVLTPALLPCLGHRLACTTIAQETRRPAGVTPSVDSEDEPVDPRLSIEFNRRYQDLRSGSPLSIDWTLTWDGPPCPGGTWMSTSFRADVSWDDCSANGKSS